ncbi:MAG TPA: L,D-transpeptidase family protein [Ilumatobacter sp.]|nr:L,D-transpeptidase family protein [Ilumatobacter sp.]
MAQTSPSDLARWLPVAAAAGLLAVVVGVGVASGGSDDGDSGPTGTSVPVVSFTSPATTTPPTYDAVDTVVTSEPVQKVALSKTLGDGMTGPEVKMVQERLAELGFDPGPADARFGTLSKQAVWAFEKLVLGTPRSEATGRVTPEMWDRMQDPIAVKPRTPTGGLGDHVEIYLPEQVMAVFHQDQPALIAHVSTGELVPGATGFTPWYEMAATYRETVTIDTDENGTILDEPIVREVEGHSYTPPGVFEAYRMIEGRRQSALGGMYDPIYINQGIAIHGAENIPLHPASHGCIRVSRYLGERLQADALIEIGDKVLIWDGVLEPHEQPAEARKMRWDRDVTTTTTTTTTSTTTTTTTSTTLVPDDPATTTTVTSASTVPGDEPPVVATTTAPVETVPPVTEP